MEGTGVLNPKITGQNKQGDTVFLTGKTNNDRPACVGIKNQKT
jgi:hypothetical protein